MERALPDSSRFASRSAALYGYNTRRSTLDEVSVEPAFPSSAMIGNIEAQAGSAESLEHADGVGFYLHAIGLNHRTASVEIRERLAFPDDRLDAAFLLLSKYAREGVILSTCNRTEIYVLAGFSDHAGRHLAHFLGDFHCLPVTDFEPHLYSLSQGEVVRHLFSVSSGIDSMIIGEPQILGQVHDAFDAASAHGMAGRVIAQLFRQAITVGRQVRAETEISRNAVSVSYAAVELGRKIFGDLRTRTVLVIGAGEMGELAAKTLVDVGVGKVVVCNRTRERAEYLAVSFGGVAADFTDLDRLLSNADIVISSTGAPGFVITPEMMGRVMNARHQRPLFLVDIAVPRDVDPAVQRYGNVFLYNVDDLQAVCAANMRERQKEIRRVEAIVDSEANKFIAWWDSLDVVPTIAALRDKVEGIRQAEVAKAFGKLGNLNEDERATINALTRAIVNKILHQPTVRLKGRGDATSGKDYSQALRELFDLDEER